MVVNSRGWVLAALHRVFAACSVVSQQAGVVRFWLRWLALWLASTTIGAGLGFMTSGYPTVF